MVSTLDVIWIYDQYIDPKDWKMAAIIEPDCLYYFRINSIDHWKPALKLERDPHHTFLKYDSYLECNLPQELDEYELEQALDGRGVIGRIHASLAKPIYSLVKANGTISPDDKTAIGLALVGANRL